MAESNDRLLRDALTIVVAGVVLGVAYNQLALASRPPRGLAWVAAPPSLESVESLTGTGSAGGAETAAVDPSTPVSSQASPTDPPVARDSERASTSTGAGALRPSAGSAGAGDASAAKPAHSIGAKSPSATSAGATARQSPSASSAGAAAGQSPSASSAGATAGQSPSASSTGAAAAAALPEIPDAKRPLKIELANVKKFVDARAAMIVDAREPDEFAAGHVPGAINISLDHAAREPERLERLDSKGTPIIVYCSGGDCEASRMLAESLMRDYGKKRVLVFEGGFPEWAGAGFPVAR